MHPDPHQDQAIGFYETLGFTKRTDVPFGGGYRWIEMYLPGDSTGIALAPPRPGEPVQPAETGITITTADVDVDAAVSRMGGGVPSMFWLHDATGHTLMPARVWAASGTVPV